MSSFFTTDDIKDFFSKPSSSEGLRLLEQHLDRLVSEIRKRNSSGETTMRHEKTTELESTIKQFKSKNRWKSASFYSILTVKAPTLLLKYALASFFTGLGIYFGCLALSEVGSQKPQGRNLAIFMVYIVTSFFGLIIYYVPSTLKQLELSSARRYAQIRANELAGDPYQEETGILRNISVLLNSEEQEVNSEHQSDNAISRERSLAGMDRPQHNHTHDLPA